MATIEIASSHSIVQTLGGLLQRIAKLLASPHILLFVTLIVAYGYTPPRWQDWNQNSRFNLTRAVVEQRTIQIDSYVGNTGDYAVFDDHVYTDKAPGLSFTAMPIYAGIHVLKPFGLQNLSQKFGASSGFQATLNPDGAGLSKERISTAVSLYLVTFFTVSIPAAMMLVLLSLIVRKLTGNERVGIACALIVGLVTPVFAYAQAFYGHVPAAACLIGALSILVLRTREQISPLALLSVGALLGWAVLIELPAVLIAIPIAGWALWQFRLTGALFLSAGALPGFLLLAVYDLFAFRSPLPVGYRYSALWQEQHSTGFLSITYPHLDAIWGLSFSPFRGLFYFSPVLILVIPGIWFALRNRHHSVVTCVAVAGFTMMFIFIASSVMWWGGFAVGPRYLVPAIPLLAIPLGFTLAWIDARPTRTQSIGWLVVGVLGIISGALIWSTTFAGQNYPPDSIRRTVAGHVLPTLQGGDVARNLGMAIQLDGLLSLIPILLIVFLGVGMTVLRLKSTAISQS